VLWRCPAASAFARVAPRSATSGIQAYTSAMELELRRSGG